jgi:predicted PurR-regulated permease PerM
LLTPWILGRAFRISPLVVFAWVVFWGWMWSVPGAALAVPLLMLMNIVFEQSRSLAAIPRLLRS